MIINDDNWYFSKSGGSVGPFRLSQMIEKVEEGEIARQTFVWSGSGDWKAAEESALSEYFQNSEEQQAEFTPPPIPPAGIDDKYAWALCAVPVLGAFFEYVFQSSIGIFTFLFFVVPNIVLGLIDERKINRSGRKSPFKWYVFIIPVYLWKRASLLNNKRSIFWVWIASFVVSIFLSEVTFASFDQDILADTACETVTEIVQENSWNAASCEAVDVQNEISDGYYRAKAYMSNGGVIPITIESDGDYIYTTLRD